MANKSCAITLRKYLQIRDLGGNTASSSPWHCILPTNSPMKRLQCCCVQTAFAQNDRIVHKYATIVLSIYMSTCAWEEQTTYGIYHTLRLAPTGKYGHVTTYVDSLTIRHLLHSINPSSYRTPELHRSFGCHNISERWFWYFGANGPTRRGLRGWRLQGRIVQGLSKALLKQRWKSGSSWFFCCRVHMDSDTFQHISTLLNTTLFSVENILLFVLL
jgi:hypothetical protein